MSSKISKTISIIFALALLIGLIIGLKYWFNISADNNTVAAVKTSADVTYLLNNQNFNIQSSNVEIKMIDEPTVTPTPIITNTTTSTMTDTVTITPTETVTTTNTTSSTPSSTPTQTLTNTSTATATATASQTETITSTQTQIPPPSPTISPSGVTTLTFQKGFTVFGGVNPIAAEQFRDQALILYRFDGPTNKWITFPGDKSFIVNGNESYYVYNPSTNAKSVTVTNPSTTQASGSHVKAGWNLLYSKSGQSISSLKFDIYSQDNQCLVSQVPAKELIDKKILKNPIFQIANYRSDQSCQYFKLLDTKSSPADCRRKRLGSIVSMSDRSSFWVYILPEKVNKDLIKLFSNYVCKVNNRVN